MENVKKLNEILLAENVVEEFHKNYVGEFKTWLDNLIPEIEKCQNQQQNNPWHKYNVLDHILHSVEEMNKQTLDMPNEDRRVLAYAMFLHDIGKPATHIVRKKKGEMIDSFFNHNIESEKVASRVLPNLNFREEDIAIIKKLVFKHDIFMFITADKTTNPYHRELNNEVLDKEIEDLSEVADGEMLMRWLVMVGRSDNRSQNEKMTANALKLLDKFDLMLDERTNEHSL